MKNEKHEKEENGKTIQKLRKKNNF